MTGALPRVAYFEHILHSHHKGITIFEDSHLHHNKRYVKALSVVKGLSLVSVN